MPESSDIEADQKFINRKGHICKVVGTGIYRGDRIPEKLLMIVYKRPTHPLIEILDRDLFKKEFTRLKDWEKKKSQSS